MNENQFLNTMVPGITLKAAILKLSAQGNEIKSLQDKLDNWTTNFWDFEDENEKKNNEIRKLKYQLSELEERTKVLTSCRDKDHLEAITASNKCKEIEEKSRKPFEIIKNLENDIKLYQQEVAKLRAAKVSDEHLARQLLKLVEENKDLREKLNDIEIQKLSHPEGSNMTDGEITRMHELVEKVNNLSEENIKFKEQTTKLLTEISKLSCPSSRLSPEELVKADNILPPCGECFGCHYQKMKNILAQTSDNLIKKNTDYDELEKKYKKDFVTNTAMRQVAYILYAGIQNILTTNRMYHDSIAYGVRKEVDKIVKEYKLW